MSDSDNHVEFEDKDDVDPDSHIRLIKAIGRLDKTQHILKPTRDGFSGTKSEFHVSKTGSSKSSAVTDIIKILQNSSEHSETGKKLKTAQKNNKTLQKPLERHEAASIKRATGFEDVKEKLGKWDAIVSRNRTIEHQKFPIETAHFKKPETKEYLSKFTLKSELENELDKLNPADEVPVVETFPMTMSELLEHRKEAARLRAKQSYKEAKSRRQSKIKSKKFHRIQRKEKIKLQLKEFEGLQKSDPEQALRKLEQMEKVRAQERVSLRHKSTGHWAKNKLVRAKYDKETRQQLAEQLAISRDLTQKSVIQESESEEEVENLPTLVEDSANPWLSSKVEPSKEVDDFVSGYKKYWETRNNVQNNNSDINTVEVSETTPENSEETLSEIINEVKDISSVEPINVKNKTKKRKLEAIIPKSTTEWNVENISKKYVPTKEKIEIESEPLSVENIFDDLEYRLQSKVKNKISILKSDDAAKKPKNKTKKTKPKNAVANDEFRKKNLRPQIDEELHETTNLGDSPEILDKINPTTKTSIDDSQNMASINTIDPNKFVAIKPRHLQSTLPDIDMDGDHLDDEENEKKMTIAEAFEDDDIVAEFQQEKDHEINKNKPQTEDLSLPGWGSWVGKGLKPSKRRNRFLFKAPAVVLPRKDDKKDNVIINESKDSKLKLHQVSELPFPFTSVSDFESTIRAPIGNSFIPETAHKKLIKPAIIVKTGIVIEPMDESQLVVMKKGKLSLVEKTKKWF